MRDRGAQRSAGPPDLPPPGTRIRPLRAPRSPGRPTFARRLESGASHGSRCSPCMIAAHLAVGTFKTVGNGSARFRARTAPRSRGRLDFSVPVIIPDSRPTTHMRVSSPNMRRTSTVAGSWRRKFSTMAVRPRSTPPVDSVTPTAGRPRPRRTPRRKWLRRGRVLPPGDPRWWHDSTRSSSRGPPCGDHLAQHRHHQPPPLTK